MFMYTCTGVRRPGKFYMGGTGAQSVGRVVEKFSEAACYGGLGAGSGSTLQQVDTKDDANVPNATPRRWGVTVFSGSRGS